MALSPGEGVFTAKMFVGPGVGAVCTKRRQSACLPCWRWSGVRSLSHIHIPPIEVEDIHIHVQTCIETCIYLLSLCTVHQIQAEWALALLRPVMIVMNCQLMLEYKQA